MCRSEKVYLDKQVDVFEKKVDTSGEIRRQTDNKRENYSTHLTNVSCRSSQTADYWRLPGRGGDHTRPGSLFKGLYDRRNARVGKLKSILRAQIILSNNEYNLIVLIISTILLIMSTDGYKIICTEIGAGWQLSRSSEHHIVTKIAMPTNSEY